jgi:hypothetical protein
MRPGSGGGGFGGVEGSQEMISPLTKIISKHKIEYDILYFIFNIKSRIKEKNALGKIPRALSKLFCVFDINQFNFKN